MAKTKTARQMFVDWSLTKPTHILIFPGPEAITLGREDLKTKKVDEEKLIAEQLLFAQSLQPQDTIWAEMGSGADSFCVYAYDFCSDIRRVPPGFLKEYREAQGLDREQTAEALYRLSQEQPQAFYPMTLVSQEIARLAVLMKNFYKIQKRYRIPLQQQGIAMGRSLRFLIPDDERRQKTEKTRREAAMEELLGYEGYLLRLLETQLAQSEFYRIYLAPIQGAGPRILGRILSSIGEIDRFPTRAQFVSYCGMDVHFGEDGQGFAPRMLRGKKLGYNPFCQQGFWNFWQYVLITPNHPLHTYYWDRRDAYMKRHPDAPEWKAHKNALRSIGSCFCHYIWAAWRHYEDPSSDKAPWRGWDLYNKWQEISKNLREKADAEAVENDADAMEETA